MKLTDVEIQAGNVFENFMPPKQAAAIPGVPEEAKGIRRLGQLLVGGRVKAMEEAMGNVGPAAVKRVAKERAQKLKDLTGSAFHRVNEEYQKRMADAANANFDLTGDIARERAAVRKARINTALGVGGTALVAAPAVYDMTTDPEPIRPRRRRLRESVDA